jgi:glycosyltransferase involved in cell wall biosynthesis
LKKLAIITTHPIQYNAPWFKLLSENGKVALKVFYTWSQLANGKKFDPGFGKQVQWDIPLLEGYAHVFVNNTSKAPGSHHRRGIINPTLNKEVEDWGADAILVFGWNFVSHWKCIRYFNKKIPVLFRGDSTLLRKQPLHIRFARALLLKWVYSFIDAAFYVGHENKKYFLSCGLKEHQLVFAPHAIDNERFADSNNSFTEKAMAWRSKLSISPDTLTVLYAGKLEAIKSPALIISFAKRFSSLPVHFIIAGNGPMESVLKESAAGLANITFIDFQNQQMMPVLYRLADFFMLCSESETWGLSINEAMACGKAIIARNTCGCVADLVREGQNGYVFNLSDLDEIYSILKELVNNNARWAAMGAESQKIIASYSFKNIVSAVEFFLTNKLN